MLSRIIGPALRISARQGVTAMTRSRIQPCLQRKLNSSDIRKINNITTYNAHSTIKCMYLSTKPQGERDHRRSDSNLEEELAKLQNNSEKNNSSVIAEFIKQASKLQRIDLATKAFELGKNSKDTSIYNAMIRAYANEGAAEDAEELFSAMTRNNIPIDAHTHAGLILAHGKTNNESKLAEYLQRLSTAELPQEEPIYTALIAAYVALRDMETAEKLFESMKQLEVPPSVRTFELLVQGYAQLNTLDQANKTLRTMKTTYNLTPSLMMLKTLIHTAVRLNDVSLARTLFASLASYGLQADAELWNEMIKLYCNTEQLDDAERALKAMRASGFEPSNAVHAEYMGGLLRMDQLTRAQAYFDNIRHETSINNRVWGRGIETYIKLKNIDQAYALVDQCLEKKINLESRVRNLLWNYSKKKQRAEDYIKRFEKVPGNVSLESLQKEGHLKMSPWTKMRIESLESDEAMPAELRNQKFNPKDWEIIDDPFSTRATPPKSQVDETETKLAAIETQLVQKFEELTNSMHVEKQKSKADMNREAFKHLDKLQVFDLSTFDVEALKDFSDATKDIREDIEDFNMTPKTDKRVKKKESAIAGKLEQRILDLLSKQRVDKLTPVMSAQIEFGAKTKQIDPDEKDDEDGEEYDEPSERKKVVKKRKSVKTSGVKVKKVKSTASVKSKVKSASKTTKKTTKKSSKK